MVGVFYVDSVLDHYMESLNTTMIQLQSFCNSWVHVIH